MMTTAPYQMPQTRTDARKGSMAMEAVIGMTLLILAISAVSEFVGSSSQLRRIQTTRSDALILAASTLEMMTVAGEDNADDTLAEFRAGARDEFKVDVVFEPEVIEDVRGRRITVKVTREANPKMNLATIRGWIPADVSNRKSPPNAVTAEPSSETPSDTPGSATQSATTKEDSDGIDE